MRRRVATLVGVSALVLAVALVGSLLASDTRGRSFRLVSQLLDADMALSVALP